MAKKEWGTVTTRFIWQDQLKIAAELNANGTFRKQFIYADSVNSPEYMFYNAKKYLFVKDNRGSILQVVDASNGEVMQKLKYSEFGEVLLDTNPGFQPFGFAGGLYDYETKLVRFGARDYDGSTGRWLSKDPIRFAGGDTNLYGYVLNDPVNLVDPEGKYWGVVIAVGRFIIGKVLGEEIGKVLPKSEQEEINKWKEEERRKREKDREGCGVIKSCEPETPPVCQ